MVVLNAVLARVIPCGTEEPVEFMSPMTVVGFVVRNAVPTSLVVEWDDV